MSNEQNRHVGPKWPSSKGLDAPAQMSKTPWMAKEREKGPLLIVVAPPPLTNSELHRIEMLKPA